MVHYFWYLILIILPGRVTHTLKWTSKSFAHRHFPSPPGALLSRRQECCVFGPDGRRSLLQLYLLDWAIINFPLTTIANIQNNVTTRDIARKVTVGNVRAIIIWITASTRNTMPNTAVMRVNFLRFEELLNRSGSPCLNTWSIIIRSGLLTATEIRKANPITPVTTGW